MNESNQATNRVVSLHLKLSDVQSILNALSNLPYIQVSKLIGEIMAQVNNPPVSSPEKKPQPQSIKREHNPSDRPPVRAGFD